MSSEVSAVKDLTEKAPHEYGVSLIGDNCGKKNCCLAGSNRFGSYCVTCCR
ncbi:hypothetical protein MKW98_005244 [Papaver atlanticum]|uniref:Uncharacterized protein n=1 Tax=Papaver atlanticum TaxID=357466 RepID=A0AAD4RWZ4_9MAGN|nr:hypothetical protein MKW98_005244 [Papaver atlanticum]